MPRTRNYTTQYTQREQNYLRYLEGLVAADNLYVFFSFQYRVESMMLRIAKPMNYIAVSPSVEQRGL